jgi:large subunit ribosomal protein L13e
LKITPAAHPRQSHPLTLSSLQEAGIARKLASTIGIAVDPRRLNTNQETLTLNVQRLKTYKSRLILFPRKSGQFKKLDSSEDDVKLASDSSKISRKVSGVLPIDSGVGIKHAFSEVKKGDLPSGEEAAYTKLRNLRADARYVGAREKRNKAKEDAEDAKKK